MRHQNITTLVTAVTLLSVGVSNEARTQERERTPEEWLRRCREWSDHDDRVRHCEVRDVTIPLSLLRDRAGD
jgi:hypothetical protein